MTTYDNPALVAPAPVAPLTVATMPEPLRRALERLDSNPGQWEGIFPDAYQGMADVDPEGGLS